MNEPDPTNLPFEPRVASNPGEAVPPASAPAEGGAAPADGNHGDGNHGDGHRGDAQQGGDGPQGGDGQPGADGPQGGDGEGGGERKRRRRRRRRGNRGAEGAGEGGEAGVPAEGELQGPRLPRPQQPRPEGRREPQKRERVHGGRGAGGRGDRGDRGDRGRGDSQHSAMFAVRALADMARALLRVEGVDPLAMPRYLDLNLRVPLDGGNDVRHAAGTAVEQILQRVREVREHEQALRPGAVYSYNTDSSHTEGCRPTEPRHVFDGYSSTGKPNFSDFVTMAIERKDPHIEQLLAGEEIVLTHVTMGRVLRTQQLAEFGGNSPVFKILGQVDAGLFRVLGAAGRCAFSFQLLRGQTLEGRVRLRLHPVGAVDPMDLADPALMQILSRFQRHLDTEALRLEGQLQGGEVDEESFVLPMLQDLAQKLQGRTRSAGRRTQHGLERSEEGQRPTSRAYPDAGEANDASILWDVDQNTVVVLGGKGRVHVFTPGGKHVTSVMMQGSAIDRRRHMGRWRQAEPEERGEFRIQVKRLIAAGQDIASEEVLPGATAMPGASDVPPQA